MTLLPRKLSLQEEKGPTLSAHSREGTEGIAKAVFGLWDSLVHRGTALAPGEKPEYNGRGFNGRVFTGWEYYIDHSPSEEGSGRENFKNTHRTSQNRQAKAVGEKLDFP